MINNQDLLDEIRASMSIESLFGHYNIKYKGTQRNLSIHCPLGTHEDKNPSFSINTVSFLWNCFACGEKGDVFTFIAKMEHLDIEKEFPEVLSIARTISGVHEITDTEELKYKYEEFVKKYENINTTTDERKLARNAYKEKRDIDIDTCDVQWEAEITGEEADIIVPMRKLDLSGDIIGAQRGRKKVMYKSSMGIFHETGIEDNVELYIVEGLSDYLSMRSAGYKNVIGVSSATINTKKLGKSLSSGFEKIHISYDTDRHKTDDNEDGTLIGAKKAVQLGKYIKNKLTQVSFYALGEENRYDLADIFRKSGRKGIEGFFKNSKTKIEYQIDLDIGNITPSYKIAMKFLKENNVAIDTNQMFFWMCDPVTNLWAETSKNNVEGIIMKYIEKEDSKHTSSLIKDAMAYISRLSEESVKKLHDSFLNGKESFGRIFLKDGIYNAKTDEFSSYVPTDYASSCIGIEGEEISKENAKPKSFLKFIEDVNEPFSDSKERIEFLQEWFGYLLMPTNIFEKFIVICGPGGNGKSTLMGAIAGVIGKRNFINVEMKNMGQRFALSSFIGTYVNMCSDMSKSSFFSNETFKKITGNDIVTVEEKFKAPFQYKAFTRFFMATNNEVVLSAEEDWIKRRMIILDFPVCFRGREDFFLKEKIADEHVEIFNWALEGARRLSKRGLFDIPMSVQKKFSQIIEDNDYVGMFLKFAKNEGSGFGLSNDFYAVYREYMTYMDVFEGHAKSQKLTKKEFILSMEKHGYVVVVKDGSYYFEKKKAVNIDLI